MIPTTGIIVNYVLPESSPKAGEIRPAIIVLLEDKEEATLQVFTNGADDGDEYASDIVRVVSRTHDEVTKSNGTWHYKNAWQTIEADS